MFLHYYYNIKFSVCKQIFYVFLYNIWKYREFRTMAKIDLDKYYTLPEISKYCIEKTFEILKGEEISEIIEPSAGAGSFSNQIENCIAYDIKPEGENIIEQDFFNFRS